VALKQLLKIKFEILKVPSNFQALK